MEVYLCYRYKRVNGNGDKSKTKEQTMNDYEEKLKRERRWYTQPIFKANHFLNSKLFYSPERNAFNYIFPKKQLSNFISRIAQSNGLKKPAILIAPIGTGDDLKYLQHLSDDISGIDISEEAVNRITDSNVEKYIGDIKNMYMFSENHFDIVVVPLFFHHFLRYGFDDFLREAYRVLKPNGHFFSLEPSSLHPVCWVTWCAKKIVGNITGAVEDEAPFIPLKLSNAMKRCGFRDIRIYGASFSHNRVPIWIARINNVVTFPMLKFPVVKYFAWMCLFYGRK